MLVIYLRELSMRIFALGLVSFLLLSCGSTPTGRSQLKLLGSDQMSAMGEQSFEELKKKGKVSSNSKLNTEVKCITNALLTSMGEAPASWEVVVFEDASPNAFALPGKKVGVHTGMITLSQNQHQLAAVIGHEIGHVLANHGNERVSQNLLAQGALQAADLYLGRDSQTDQLIIGALGVGAQYGVLLPFSRKQESEADRLGIEYMAKAGFDPRQAPELWQVMKQKAGGGTPEFLSTHPSPSSRIKDLGELVPDYLPAYQSAQNKPNCR